MTGPIPLCGSEAERLDALYGYAVLDTLPEPAFDDLTRLIREICGTSIALITLIDQDRQWFKSEIGLGRRETTLDLSICAHAIRQDDLLIVPDLNADPRFRDHPAVAGWPYLRFYAGAPIRAPSGYALGTFCVADTVPRQLHASQIDALRILARQAMALLDLHKAKIMPAALSHAEEQVVQARAAIIGELQHRFRNNLQTIDSLISLQAHQEQAPEGRLAIGRLRDRLQPLYLIQGCAVAGGDGAVDLRAYLHGVAQAARNRHRGRISQVEWLEAIDEISLSQEMALPLGLIVNEFFANSFRHAFPGGAGHLEIRLTRLQDRRAVLQLADDGPGFVVMLRPALHGLGLQLITALSRQLAAKPAWDTTRGTKLTLEFATG